MNRSYKWGCHPAVCQKTESTGFLKKRDWNYRSAYDGDVEERFISTSQTETRVLLTGSPDKPPMIMLHGTRMSGAMLLDAVKPFADHFFVMIPDLPGETGFTMVSCIPKEVSFYTQWIDELADGLGLQRFYLTGASLGSFFGLNYGAGESGSRVIKAGYIASGGITGIRPRFLIQGILSTLFPSEKAMASLLNWMRGPDLPPVSIQEIKENLEAAEKLRVNHRIMPVKMTDRILRSHKPPACFLYGADEVLNKADEAEARISALMPDSSVVLVPRRRHILIPEDYRPLLDFLLSA